MAFGSFDKNENSVMSEINVTPLVDVMLVLLIVFMITMPILTQSIPLELPTSSIEKKDEPKDIFRVAINPTGIYLGEKLVNEEELKQSFLTKFQENKNTVIAISADISVEYQHIVKVLELAQNVGLTKIGFVTQPSK
ncbi:MULTISPECIES: ExbD/TolR family protein [Actinobacillus]|uniref:Biopolymer transport ExbD protein n=8 Tax=Pasteurellaceae TaxID=712 RepID=A3N2L7_ACTP2|nr:MULTISPECIES: biopolymer transporter ExbD [Actinobacillus]AAV68898.1 ExbD [Glaesserella parasuis]AAV68903.1 ExbD [Glaesserella parasuis str. Nagasaki]AAM63531.1 ExbD [Actinobacillus suis]AAM63535.1 ExbD [Actinobacillus suis]ABN74653.1 biopolymer transport ExbD protein [Actinobacillus pleuropneumoniae serovar 5b str. L20]